MANITRDEAGNLPHFAWPGGYSLVYTTEDGGLLCSHCANRENGSEASEDSEDSQWRLVDVDVYWEGPSIYCDHCNKELDSEYGDPNKDEGDV